MMKDVCLLFIVLALGLHANPALAQDALREVPDPDPQRELEMLRVPEGYEINLFAAEPMIAKPVQMNWDEHGRLWVASSTAYPQVVPGQIPNDKIIVLEDTDGDGQADQSTVFADSLLTPTGLMPGDGGVYVANSTEILHLQDTDGDGRADQRRVLLRGFGQDDTHHLIHTFRWGPEARLYLNQAIYIYSHIETPWGPRRLEGGGIWQLWPQTLELDVFARGFYNPWGHEFDRWGQSFVTDGAGFQGINYAFPGAQFEAAKGAERVLDGLNQNHPKYAGLEILSGRHLPDSLQGQILTNDYRANQVNRFILSEDDSGFASEEAGEFVWTKHVAFRPVDVRMGPDGAIYLADWYNPIIQHGEVDFRDPRRDHKHGRIWRITAKGRPLVEPPKLAGADVQGLLDALKLPEAWTRRQAKRLLKERGAQDVAPAIASWVEALDPQDGTYEHHLLEALWTSQAVDAVNAPLLEQVLTASDPRARAAAVRVLYYWSDRVEHADSLLARAARDEHPRVRREAVTALEHRPSASAARTALTVLDQPMDRFLDFALWNTLRTLEPHWLPRLKDDPNYLGDPQKLVFALKASRAPYAAARLAEMYAAGEVPDVYQQDALGTLATYGGADDLQRVFEQALVGNGDVRAELAALQEAAEQHERQPTGDLRQIGRFLEADDDQVAAVAARLVGYWKIESLRDSLVHLANETPVEMRREAAVSGLALMGDEASTTALVEMTSPNHPLPLQLLAATTLPSVDLETAARTSVAVLNQVPPGTDPSELFQALFEQEEGTRLMAEALADQGVPPEMAQAGLRAIQAKGDRWMKSNSAAATVQAALEKIGGPLPPPRMPQNLSAIEMDRLELDVKASGDAERGEAVYRRPSLLCMTCHAIGGAGGKAGPDLSSLGASAPMDYIIEALLKPDQAVKDGYSLITVTKTDGSVVSGLLVRETDREVVLRDLADQEVSIPASQVQERAISPGSLMPAGLTAQLEREEFMDLVQFLAELGESQAYSAQPGQVRRWRVLADTEKAREALRQGGTSALLEADAEELAWQPHYSTVAGVLPLADVPAVSYGGEENYSFVWFELDAQTSGTVRLGLNAAEGLSLWVDGEAVQSIGEEVSLELSEGVHRVTVAVDRDAREAPLQVRVLEGPARPVVGK